MTAATSYGGAELRLVAPRMLPGTVAPVIMLVVVSGSPPDAPLNR